MTTPIESTAFAATVQRNTRPIENKTANYSVVIEDHSTIFTNVGAGGVLEFILPPNIDCTPGKTTFRFLDIYGSGLSIEPDSGEIIFEAGGSTYTANSGVPATNNATVGSFFDVLYMGNDIWSGVGGVAWDMNETVFRVGGIDVPVADGGTGASTAAGARTNLDLDAATRTIVAKTADYPIVAGDHDTIFTNEGSTAHVTYTLPTTGLTAGKTRFHFFHIDADSHAMQITPGGAHHLIVPGADITNPTAYTDGGTLGFWLTVVYMGSSIWAVEKQTGSWS